MVGGLGLSLGQFLRLQAAANEAPEPLKATALSVIQIYLPGGMAARWLLCAALIAVPYAMLGRAVDPRIGPRTYRYAGEASQVSAT